MPIRILRRKLNGGPFDGQERLLNADVYEWRESDWRGGVDINGEHNDIINFDHVYKLGSDMEFHYEGKS